MDRDGAGEGVSVVRAVVDETGWSSDNEEKERLN